MKCLACGGDLHGDKKRLCYKCEEKAIEIRKKILEQKKKCDVGQQNGGRGCYDVELDCKILDFDNNYCGVPAFIKHLLGE